MADKVTVTVMPVSIHPMLKKQSIESRVDEAIDNVESGSKHVDEDWALLHKVHSELQRKKCNDRMQKLLDKIDAVMVKYDRTIEEKE